MDRLTRCLLLFVIFSSCYAKSSDHALSDMPLNGIWNFLASNDIEEKALRTQSYDQWDSITVPGNWDKHDKCIEYAIKGY